VPPAMHVVRSAGRVAAVMLVVLLTSQMANAQGSTATVAVTVAAGPTPVAQGGQIAIPVTVQFSINGAVCAQPPATATVHLAVVDPSPLTGITFTLPATVVFDLKAPQAYSTAAFSEQQTVNLNVSVASGTLPNHLHNVNVTASFDGASADLTNCTITPATVPGTSVAPTDSKPVGITTGADVGVGPGGNTTTPIGPGGTTSEPAVSLPIGIQMALLVGLGLLSVRRRK